MAKDKSILEKAKEGIEHLGEKGGQVMKNMSGEEHTEKKTSHHKTARRTKKK